MQYPSTLFPTGVGKHAGPVTSGNHVPAPGLLLRVKSRGLLSSTDRAKLVISRNALMGCLAAWPRVPAHFCLGQKLQAAQQCYAGMRGPQELPVSNVMFSGCS